MKADAREAAGAGPRAEQLPRRQQEAGGSGSAEGISHAELQPQAGSIEAHALARHVRMSPQKGAGDGLDPRAKGAGSAAKRCASRRSARPAHRKVLRSAIQRERKAEDAGAPLDVDELFVTTAFVTKARAGSCCVPRRWAARSLPEAHRASVGRRRRASRRRSATRCRYRAGSRSAKGCACTALACARLCRQAASPKRARSKSAG